MLEREMMNVSLTSDCERWKLGMGFPNGRFPILKPMVQDSSPGPPRIWSAVLVNTNTKPFLQKQTADPCRRWDDERSSSHQRASDSHHETTEQSLWIDGWHNQGCVEDILEETYSDSNGMNCDKESGVQTRSNSTGHPALVEETAQHGLIYEAIFSSAAQGDPSQAKQENRDWETLSVEEACTCLEHKVELPSVESFICILRKCRKKKDLAYAKHLHLYVCSNGLEGHRALGNHLVPMFVDCGSLADAQQAFNKLVYPNEFSWTSLILGYFKCGEAWHALNIYQKMREDFVHPSRYTFVPLLKACERLNCLERGREVHADIIRAGHETDLFISSTLVDMYAKCGSVAEAQTCFDMVPVRDVVLWTTLIAGYAENGLGEEGMNCFQQMQLEGISPTAVTFVCSLKACISLGAIHIGQEIHAYITEKGYENDLIVGSSLVDMYATCGALEVAREVFEKLPVRDVVSWTALITRYAELGLGQEALDRFEEMHWEGVSPSAFTFACSLKACCSIRALDRGRKLHMEIIKQGFEDLYVNSTLLDMYVKCGSLAEAQEVFDKLSVRDVVFWNVLISGYVEHGLGEEVLIILERMFLEGSPPDAVTLMWSLKACSCIGALDKGRECHSEITKQGFERDPFVSCTLVDLYAKCSALVESQEIFNRLPDQDLVSWNTLISGYAQYGLGEEALNCLEQMQGDRVSPDIVSWNSVILAHAEQGESERAFELYSEMQEQGLLPNDTVFVSILKTCGNTAALETGKTIHAQINGVLGLEATDGAMATALVDMYGKCGSMVDAQEVFDATSMRDLAPWNALMTGYARHGESEVVFQLFERMREDATQPDGTTFLTILTVCSHVGLVEKGQRYFEAMTNEYGITPTIKHHTCIVDLLGRAGQLDDAIMMLEKMFLKTDFVVWTTILGACRNWGNVELAREAFELAIRLDESHGAAFLLMYNIYADAHMWEEAMNIEAMRVKLSV